MTKLTIKNKKFKMYKNLIDRATEIDGGGGRVEGKIGDDTFQIKLDVCMMHYVVEVVTVINNRIWFQEKFLSPDDIAVIINYGVDKRFENSDSKKEEFIKTARKMTE